MARVTSQADMELVSARLYGTHKDKDKGISIGKCNQHRQV